MAELQPTKLTHQWRLLFEGAWPTSTAFAGSPRRIAAGNRDGLIYVWDLPEEPPESEEKEPAKGEKKSTDDGADVSPTLRLDGHTNGITHLVATADGKTLISASLDHTVRIWDLTASPDGTAEAVLDQEQREREAKKTRSEEPLNRPGVPVKTMKAAFVLEEHTDWVTGLGLSGDERRLITADDAAHVIVWDLQNRKAVSRWQGEPFNGVSSTALSPSGDMAFVAEYRSKRGDFDRPPAQVRFYNADDGQMILDVMPVLFPKVKDRDSSYGYATTWNKILARGLVGAAWSPDGKLLAAGQSGETGTGKVHLFDVETGKIVRTVSGHQSGATDVAFSRDGKHVISVGRDTQVRICQVSDGKELAALGESRGGQFKDWLHSVSLSPDQTAIAAADIAGYVQVWVTEG